MIYFKLPTPRKMLDDRVRFKLTETTIVSYSLASWQIHRGQYLNWHSFGCTGYTEKFAGFDVKRVSWLAYARRRIGCLASWILGYGFYMKP